MRAFFVPGLPCVAGVAGVGLTPAATAAMPLPEALAGLGLASGSARFLSMLQVHVFRIGLGYLPANAVA